MVRYEVGLHLDKVNKDILGTVAIVLTEDMTTIVGDGSTYEDVNE